MKNLTREYEEGLILSKKPRTAHDELNEVLQEQKESITCETSVSVATEATTDTQSEDELKEKPIVGSCINESDESAESQLEPFARGTEPIKRGRGKRITRTDKKVALMEKCEKLVKQIQEIEKVEEAERQKHFESLAIAIGTFVLSDENYEKIGKNILSDPAFEKSLHPKERNILDNFRKNPDSEQLLSPEGAVEYIQNKLAKAGKQLSKKMEKHILNPLGSEEF
jgi:hypothetical protein